MMGSPAQIAAAGRQIASPIRGGLGFGGINHIFSGATASTGLLWGQQEVCLKL